MKLPQALAGRSVLIVGDVMLDEYVWGDVERISPEAPVPVLEFRRRTYVVGGAGNAAANIASLQGRALLAGVVGEDAEADVLLSALTERGVDAHLVPIADRPTTTKTRVVAGSQQILRIDREDRIPVAQHEESSILEWASAHISSVDAVLVSDYGKGVVTHGLCLGLIDLARAERKTLVVDPKGRDYSKYVGATAVTPNALEVRLAVEPLSLSSGELEADVATLRSLLRGTSIVVTLGPEGVSLFRPDGSSLDIASRVRSVFDVTGAGDTLVATLTLALAAGGTIDDAAILANAAAGIVVGKVGTATVDLTELESNVRID